MSGRGEDRIEGDPDVVALENKAAALRQSLEDEKKLTDNLKGQVERLNERNIALREALRSLIAIWDV